MANILSSADFKGRKYNIPDATSSIAYGKIDEAIGLYENKYLNRLLGVAFAVDIKAYMVATAPTAIPDYDKIINALSIQPAGCDILESEGIKELLKACVYYEYVKNGIKNTIAGAAVAQAEVSTIISPSATVRFAENKFNEIIDTAECIQRYCMDNPTIYTTFEGRRFVVKASDFL